jgi:hypothetical protein
VLAETTYEVRKGGLFGLCVGIQINDNVFVDHGLYNVFVDHGLYHPVNKLYRHLRDRITLLHLALIYDRIPLFLEMWEKCGFCKVPTTEKGLTLKSTNGNGSRGHREANFQKFQDGYIRHDLLEKEWWKNCE